MDHVSRNGQQATSIKERTVDQLVHVADLIRDESAQIRSRLEALAGRLGHHPPKDAEPSKVNPVPSSALEKVGNAHRHTQNINSDSLRLLCEIEKHI